MPAIAWPVLMPAHALATRLNLAIPAVNPGILSRKEEQQQSSAWRPFIAKTIDVGGASPISAIAEAERLCEVETEFFFRKQRFEKGEKGPSPTTYQLNRK